MRPHKVIDVVIQSLMIVIALIATINHPQDLQINIALLYLLIGPYQVIGLLISLTKLPLSPARILYSKGLIVFAFGTLFAVMTEAVWLFLVVFAGVLGAYYYFICIIETFRTTKKI